MKLNRLGREWEWPDGDQKCWLSVFDELVAIKKLTPHLKDRRTVIQAGGNMGVFPWALSSFFNYVLTAEPDPECYSYLIKNVGYLSNVECLNVAFMDISGQVHIENDRPGNMGAQFVQPDGDVPAEPIDALGILNCDLIYLDIEGAELLALKGAQQTIELTKPLICVEDKGLSSRFGSNRGDIGRWLKQFGYEEVERIKRDVVYKA